MKIVKYKILARTNLGTEEVPAWKEELLPVEIHCCFNTLQENEIIARREAYNGEYTVEDDTNEPIPNQLDCVEAQTMYTAMMTDTLLEV